MAAVGPAAAWALLGRPRSLLHFTKPIFNKIFGGAPYTLRVGSTTLSQTGRLLPWKAATWYVDVDVQPVGLYIYNTSSTVGSNVMRTSTAYTRKGTIVGCPSWLLAANLRWSTVYFC